MARILIVEDEPDIAMGLEEDLTAHGHEVEVAKDGDAGVRRGREQSWDVILLDLMLPRRDGFEVARVDDVAKVLDFGLVKARDLPTQVQLTAANATLGTPLYMSPEAVKS